MASILPLSYRRQPMFEFDIFFIYLMTSSFIILGAASIALTIQVFKSRQEITQLSSEISNHLEPQSILKLLKAQEDSFNQALILSESNITNSLENFSTTLKELIDEYDEGINKVHQVPTQLFQTLITPQQMISRKRSGL